MLDMLDIAIGFATVMLAISLIIMSLTQACASALALRGAKLRRGLEELIKQALPDLADKAGELSRKVIRHPLVSDSAVREKGRWSWASAIKREELIPVLEAVLKESGLQPLADAQKDALEAWFESFMARVSQWFVMNTRWITVGLGVIVAFALHLDSLAVLKQIQADASTRAKLSAMSASLLDQTPDAIARVENAYLDGLSDVVKSSAAQLSDIVIPEGTITSRAQGLAWIQQKAKTPADVAGLNAEFNQAVDDRLTKALDKSLDRARTLQTDVTAAGISLVPSAEHTWRESLDPTSSHLWGIIASVLFLSLGAPFWFNVLKSATSLRSVVAQKEAAAPPAATTTTTTRSLVAPDARPTRHRLPDLPDKPAQV